MRAPERTKPRIMIVDDSEICRESARISLEEHGFEVVLLDSPFGFSRRLIQDKPDLVLMDVSMPALQGDSLVEIALQRRLHECTILLFSSLPEPELAELAKRCGAAGFVPKTGDPELLVRTVSFFLPRGRSDGTRPPTTRGPTER